VQTKQDIAKRYGVKARTVSNWLQRARKVEGESFPSNYEGSALVFTDAQVEILLEYAGDSVKRGEPVSTIDYPDPPDTDQSVAVVNAEIVPAQGFVPSEVTTITITRHYQDTTALEAGTERAQHITGDLYRQLNEAVAADTQSALLAMLARRDNALAAIEQNAIARAAQGA
jgi:hypothetical protein